MNPIHCLLADADPDVGTAILLILALVGVLIFAFIGRLIGQRKGQSEGGAALGALLGPIGLVGAAFLPDGRRKCPACKGGVPDDARKCMHCGEDLPRTVSTAPAPAPAPAPAAPVAPVPLITWAACPLCAAKINAAVLKLGENYCPHCYEKFNVER